MNGLVSVLRSKLGDPIEGSGDEVRFNCFRMHNGKPDQKRHLYVNVVTKRWVCFRCQSSNGKYVGGDIQSLFRAIGIPTDLPVESIERTTFDTIIAQLVPGPLPLTRKAVALTYPCETRPLVPGTAAWQYLTGDKQCPLFYLGSQAVYGRGMSQEQILPYQLSWGTYAGADRIFVPTYSPDTGAMIYWTARAFRGLNDAMRYVNPSHEEATGGFIFNLDRARRSDTVVICEGVFSAIAAGPNAVALFGKVLTRNQLPLLFEVPFTNYVVALDGDARVEAISVSRLIAFRGCRTYMVELPSGTDPASVGCWCTYLSCARQVNLESLVCMGLES